LKVYRKIEEFKNIKNPIVTVGTFDGVHLGHQKIIAKLKEIAKQKGGETVLLTFFPHPRLVIFPNDNELKLINTLDEKIELLKQFGLDHLIILPFDKTFSRISPTAYVRDFLVNKINVKNLVIGYDHRFGRNREGDLELLTELSPIYDFELEEITAQEIAEIKVSSTKIREALLSGDIITATKYLQHSFTINGSITKGKKIGRTIGFPTANIKIEESYKIIPQDGAYVIKATIDGIVYDGMLNIGKRPTVDDSQQKTIEAYLFELDHDVYDKKIKVSFIKKLRDEKKYNSIEELKQQLTKDKIASELILKEC